jgi:Helicase conserved C-terminal domain
VLLHLCDASLRHFCSACVFLFSASLLVGLLLCHDCIVGSEHYSNSHITAAAVLNCYMMLFVCSIVYLQGLDFPDIQHVINFDMPAEIENYVHRIGRTGRCGKTGVATTFINKVSLCYTLCLLHDAAACTRL